MKQKVFLTCLVLLLTLLAVSCGSKQQPTPTYTPEDQRISYESRDLCQTPQPAPTNAPESSDKGECNPSTKRIEMNTSLSEGIGPSYNWPDVYSVYCLWVPNGAQLKIGISDLYSDLKMYVAQDLFTRWDSSGSGTEDKIVTISNPSGRYYIWVYPQDTSVHYTKVGNTLIETSDARFTLFNEFTP